MIMLVTKTNHNNNNKNSNNNNIFFHNIILVTAGFTFSIQRYRTLDLYLLFYILLIVCNLKRQTVDCKVRLQSLSRNLLKFKLYIR